MIHFVAGIEKRHLLVDPDFLFNNDRVYFRTNLLVSDDTNLPVLQHLAWLDASCHNSSTSFVFASRLTLGEACHTFF
jgi:hypothetical protein